MKNAESPSSSAPYALGLLGLVSLLIFVAVFASIPWAWSMFMDDTLYNTWMPQVKDLRAAFAHEVSNYLELGRFYPVKYAMNLLKWRYLPNDPYVFRCFNFAVYLSAVSACAGAVLRLTRFLPATPRARAALFFFIVGTSVLHKPILEVISLNPLGELWIFFFLGLASFCLFSENAFARYLLARVFFVLVSFSKEPAALVFFAASVHYAWIAWRDPRGRRGFWLAQAALDLAIFLSLLVLAVTVMRHGIFTQNAYFGTTPWGQYAHDLLYKSARYLVWTSPFVALFLLGGRALVDLFRAAPARFTAGALFFLAFGAGYAVFMATQGIVAYQESPASMGYFGLFALLATGLALFRPGQAVFHRYWLLLLPLFAFSYFISVARWQRFVRGYVEPRRAVERLVLEENPVTIIVPTGEVTDHIKQIILNAHHEGRVFEASSAAQHVKEFRGKVALLEFPYYMGPYTKELIDSLGAAVGGWADEDDEGSYRIFLSRQTFGEEKK